jgi:hypothetical protein
MAKQTFIYNSSSPTNPNVNNPFTVEKTALLRAAGLTETVAVYMAVGDCMECQNDILWEPLMNCGFPVTIGPDNNRIVIAIPGKYSLGDPSTPLVLAGNVNITKEEGVVPSQLAGSCSSPTTPCEPLAGGLQTSW